MTAPADAADQTLQPFLESAEREGQRLRAAFGRDSPATADATVDRLTDRYRELFAEYEAQHARSRVRIPRWVIGWATVIAGTTLVVLLVPISPGRHFLVVGFWVLTFLGTIMLGARPTARQERAKQLLWNAALKGLGMPMLSPAPPTTAPRALRPAAQGPAGAPPHRQAEVFAADWMRRQGCVDARVTQASNDGGIDVTSSRYVAQVKHYASAVGPTPVRELYGVAQAHGKLAVFFTSTGYTAAAREFADARVALFVYESNGAVHAKNAAAGQLLRTGLR